MHISKCFRTRSTWTVWHRLDSQPHAPPTYPVSLLCQEVGSSCVRLQSCKVCTQAWVHPCESHQHCGAINNISTTHLCHPFPHGCRCQANVSRHPGAEQHGQLLTHVHAPDAPRQCSGNAPPLHHPPSNIQGNTISPVKYTGRPAHTINRPQPSCQFTSWN